MNVFKPCLQLYRHVDNIMFENGNIVDRFLNYWRSFGHQRIGFLYGRYEAYNAVPLGIRAVVAAIYEPPQVGNRVLFDFSYDAKRNVRLGNVER